MHHSGSRIVAVAVFVAAHLVLAGTVYPQAERAGVVVALEGAAVVARASESAPLKFKDDVFVHDRITTGERSIVRVLLGGKATVTAREHSVLVITEVPGSTTIGLSSGRVAVAVSKDLIKPGEVVEIRMPNAVAAIRGTIVVAEVDGPTSLVTVLRGLIEVTRIDPVTRSTIGAPRDVAALQTITVTGTTPAPLPPPTRISAEHSRRMSADFIVLPKRPLAGSTEPAVHASLELAMKEKAELPPTTMEGRPSHNRAVTRPGGSVVKAPTVSALPH
jgi:hypothetical protein